MRKLFVMTIVGAFLGVGGDTVAASKVTICHIPPGNPREAHTSQVSASAVSNHLSHGDYLGECHLCEPASTLPCYGGPTGTEGVGQCHAGTQICTDGTGYGSCTGEVTPVAEVCGDGLDNDCDGVADDGCVCAPGAGTACYDGPSGTQGVGACAPGIQTCNLNGTGYGACIGEVTPAAEVCGDGIDNDCDGTSDDGCVCSPGSNAPCYSGPAGTEGVGVCSAGTQACNSAGTGYGACVGDITPAADVCGDGLDNDCDGFPDDGCVCVPGAQVECYDGPTGTAGVGACATGVRTCNATGSAYGACLGQVTPVAETCGDSIDNDCDGQADEDCICAPGATAACYGGSPDTEDVGTCMSGLQTCNASGTSYGACIGETTPVSEVCGDGLDNDCDGTVDDGCVCIPGSAAACYGGPTGTEGVGACASGVQTCNPFGTGYGVCTGDITPVPEVCGDGIDNDCDGSVDEGCIGDRAWQDLDSDGIQDAGEPGLPGVVLLLRSSATGALIAVTTSDANGRYFFSSVPAGNYYVEVVVPTGLLLTAPDQGGNDAVDSDIDCYVASRNGALFRAQTFDPNDYYVMAFLDLDGDERHDASEPYEIYHDRGVPPADPVRAALDPPAIDLTFGDEYLAPTTPSPTPTATNTRTATVTATATPTATPTLTPMPCPGDCDGSHAVTIDEFILLVRVALDNTRPDRCAAGDRNENDRIEITELVAALQRVAAGCDGAR